MLEYENQMLLDIINSDVLLISAKGLSYDTVLINLIKIFCDPGELVLILGATNEEEQFFISELESMNITNLPKVITSESAVSDRDAIYLAGGVLFISSRILVVDLLKNRVPVANISGFIVLRAHRILESCQDAFALRLYRQRNHSGFVNAFSHSPQLFTSGMMKLERIMKTLFVSTLSLWPRFHALVSSTLKQKEPAVIELQLDMTPKMVTIQTAILDCVNFCIKEIKRINPTLDTEEITVENALSKTFYKLLQVQLDPVWNQLNAKTKQLICDLKTLRTVIVALTQSDCVRLHKLLLSLRSKEYTSKNAGWMMLDAAETLFVTTKSRIFNSKQGQFYEIFSEKEIGIFYFTYLSLEHNPKWETLNEILIEVERDDESKDTQSTVLILVESRYTVTQLKEVLTDGAEEMLNDKYKLFFGSDGSLKEDSQNLEEEEASNLVDSITLSQVKAEDDDNNVTFTECTQVSKIQNKTRRSTSNESRISCFGGLLIGKRIRIKRVDTNCSHEFSLDELDNNSSFCDKYPKNLKDPVIFIQQFKKDGDGLFLPKSLKERKPTTIVMYDIDVSAIRQIEIYQSSLEKQLKVYFLMYGNSVEEQVYLTALRKEKQAFEYLIKEKSVILIYQQKRSKERSHYNGVVCTIYISPIKKSTRAGGGEVEPITLPKVIVDMREFRSELPSLLYKRGIDIEPVTLQVGDYILSPEMCVERKSISDLIGSLNSGRLYTQALSMTRYYSKPILLIEFDEKKPFVLQGRYYLSSDASSNDIRSKLQLLTLHFPRLRIVWSPSPFATAQLFHELKEGKGEPSASAAAAVGNEDAHLEDERLEKYNIEIQDFVSKLPGVNSKNVNYLLNKGKSLPHLLTLSKEEISEILGNNVNGELLFNSLHNKISPNAEVAGSNYR
uniref:DNA repair endonuclease XPF n=1 Tax=Rhodnius prolixus TaxID=13249 RepID=T1HKQ6_RHOPR